MYPDFKELFSTLNAHKVKYLVVGGYAVGFHSQPRATKDLDIFIGPDEQNARGVYDALARFGAPIQNLTPRDLLDPIDSFRMGHAPLMIEILPVIKGIEFDDAWERRVEIVIDVDAIRRAEEAQKTRPLQKAPGKWGSPVLDPLTVTVLKPVLALGRLLLLACFGRRLL